MVQLFLNNSECDLYGDETIATDYSIAPISNIASRGSAKSIAFKIPLTANNRAIIENANVIVNASTLPYRFIPAILKANKLSQGIEFAQIVSIKNDIEIKLFGSNIDFFSIIKALKLEDLGSVFDHDWTLANAYASRNNTSGYIYAMIDMHADSPNTYINNTDAEIDVRGLLPSVYLHSVIDEIISQAGFTAQGNFLSDADYRSVILPCTNTFPNDLHFVDTFDFTAAMGFAQWNPLWIFSDTDGIILKAGSTVTFRGVTNISEYIVLRMTADFEIQAGIIGWWFFEVVDSNGLTYDDGIAGVTPDIVYDFVQGDDYNVTFDLIFENPTGENVDLNFGFLFDTVFPTYEIVRAFRFGTDFGSYMAISYLLPDLKQSDLLKDTVQKFGLILQVDNVNKIVHVRRFSEILDNVDNALDWSSKVDYMEKPELQFNSDYAQRNRCTYTEDDTVIKPPGTDSEILIDNQNLEAEKELFESPFAASEQVLRFGGHSIAQIKIFTDLGGADEEIADVEPRYLIVREQSFSPVFTYTDGTSNQTTAIVPVTHFILSGQDFNAGFENNLLDNSADLIALIQEYKLVKMLMRLSAADINQLDFFIPVWIELKGQPACYYYISQIKQFKVTSKESTEVELVKLNTNG